MYISKLTLTGFKSFLKKTKIVFDRGVTCIVGPNGCGKTNIVDAIRWVIGEQKSRILRADRNVDMIFNGSEKRRPANFAEVSLTIHNVSGKMPIDYTDVLITRRVFRNSDSEYLINKTPCRLKDITDLFIDTGMGANAYSVIELKMVEDILSETPQERRQLFEEAAGINKYHKQRKSTLRKLDATKEDLTRVEDIIGEVKTKVRSLKRQLRRYKRYQKTTEKLVDAEVKLASRQVLDLQQEAQPKQEQLEDKNNKVEQINEEIEELNSSIKENRKQFEKIEQNLDKNKEKLEKKKEKRNSLQADNRVFKEKRNNLSEDIKRLEQEIKDSAKNIQSAKQRSQESKKEATQIDEQLQKKKKEYERASEKFQKIEEKHNKIEEELNELQDQRYDLVRKTSEITASQNHLKENIEERQKELDEIKTKIENGQANKNKLEDKKTENETKIEEQKKKLERLEQDLNREQAKQEELQKKETQLLKNKRKLDSRLDQLQNKIDFYSELIQNKEGFEPAVKFILDNRDDFPGIKGALSELIYTDQKYYQAIEAYLSDLSELIVAENKKAALNSIKKLEQMDKGRVTIIPMDLEINGKMQNGQINEAEALAPQVKCRNEMEPIKNFIFSDVYFSDDQNFDELVKSPDFDNKVLVTEQGRISNNGFLTGGEQASGNLLVGREDQLNEFEKKYDQLSFDHEDLEGELSTLDQRKKQIKNKLQNLSSSIEKTKNQIRKNEKQKDQLDNKIYRLDTELKSWNEKRVNLKVTIKNFKNKLKTDSPGLEKLQNQISELDNKIGDKKEELKQIEEQLNKQNTALQNARVERVNLKNKLRNAKENEKAALKSIKKFQQKKENDKQKIETRKKNKKELSQKIQKNTLELEKVEKEVKKYKDKVYRISKKYRQKRKKIQSLNEEMLKKRQSREYLSDEIKKLELKLSDYRSKQKEIKAVLAKQYEKKIIDPLDDQELPELEKAEKKVERLKKRLKKIGTVNMEVKDEYEKESERLSFLEEQRDDLVESRESLQKIIEEIDEVAREKFMTTFEQIKENFQSIFNIFFKGGEADLKLLGDDPLDSKIEIFARPGGKKLRSIRMLSAGEKTLTAIALVFGIYQVKPSPFCILDEVDAPLDDANTRRFLEMIDSFSDNTQFIIVTHNKITMSAADNLYGVTMSEKGVSQIVSTKMEEEIQQLI